MKRISLFAGSAVAMTMIIGIYSAKWIAGETRTIQVKFDQMEIKSMATSNIVSDVDAFVTAQNQNRGGALAGGAMLPLDYNALTGTVPSGGNAVSGISGIASGAAAIALPSIQIGNAVVIDGGVSTAASTGGIDSYSFLVGTNGAVTMTDNNNGNSESITGASYLVFDGAATTSTGAYQSAYLIETGVNAEIASIYNAALGRVPDFAGLEFYAIPIADGSLTLHQAAAYFLASPEFTKLYPALTAPADNGGPNDQTFITELYGNILHRAPSAAEVSYYVDALKGTLTTSAGAAIQAIDRAQLLVYFSISPENQADISASNGGWLINPANGAQNFGALGQAAASAVLASDMTKGTINANDFSGMSPKTYAQQENVLVAEVGSSPDGVLAGVNYIDVTVANITVDLNATYNFVLAGGSGDIVNGYSGGGSIISVSGFGPGQNAAAVNLFGNGNAVSMASGGAAAPIVTPTLVHGWNSTDFIATYPTNTGNWGPNLTVYTGNPNSPISFASIQAGTVIVVNLGSISAATPSAEVAAIAAAADADLTVGAARINSPTVNFFAQNGADTVIYHWRGDSTHSGHVLASDFDGAVDLVGVLATTLTSANFH